MKQLLFQEHMKLGLQHMFDIIVHHLLTQMEQSRDPVVSVEDGSGKGCLYRGPNGLQCAIGPFIADSQYNEELECTVVVNLPFVQEYECESLERTVLMTFLDSCQKIHDHSVPADWYDKLQELAEYHHLAFNPPVPVKNDHGSYFLPIDEEVTAVVSGHWNYRTVDFVTGFYAGKSTKHVTLDSGAKHQVMGYSYQFLKKTANISGLEEFTLDNLTRIYQQE